MCPKPTISSVHTVCPLPLPCSTLTKAFLLFSSVLGLFFSLPFFPNKSPRGTESTWQTVSHRPVQSSLRLEMWQLQTGCSNNKHCQVKHRHHRHKAGAIIPQTSTHLFGTPCTPRFDLPLHLHLLAASRGLSRHNLNLRALLSKNRMVRKAPMTTSTFTVSTRNSSTKSLSPIQDEATKREHIVSLSCRV